MKPLLAITMGDTNGIGPEILAKALARDSLWATCAPVVIGSLRVLQAARALTPACPEPHLVTDLSAVSARPEDGVSVLEAGVEAPEWDPGRLDAAANRCAVAWLREAVRLAMAGTVAGLVTCPLNKEGIHLAGYSYPGHTEIIAEMTDSPDYRMCLFAGAMRIVHLTSHHSMADAIRLVRRERIVKTVAIAHDCLTRLGLVRRKIAVSGLNPHAGEAGVLGTEELTDIAPAVDECRSLGVDCLGPLPPDTVFRRMHMGEFDLVVAMYHDQGHIPLKLIAMDHGVNVTLGIPIIRTSVDHGTAYDIAGKGLAHEDSLCAAVELAAQFAALGVNRA